MEEASPLNIPVPANRAGSYLAAIKDSISCAREKLSRLNCSSTHASWRVSAYADTPSCGRPHSSSASRASAVIATHLMLESSGTDCLALYTCARFSKKTNWLAMPGCFEAIAPGRLTAIETSGGSIPYTTSTSPDEDARADTEGTMKARRVYQPQFVVLK